MNPCLLSQLRLMLPNADGALTSFTLSEPRQYPPQPARAFNRVAFAAAHIVADARAANAPFCDCNIDWDRTIAHREHLWNLGFAVAEAMDTAQRGSGLDWPKSRELIRRAVAAGKRWSHANGRLARIASGCGTDDLEPAGVCSVADVIGAYERQMEAIEAAGGRLIVMASRALARIAKSSSDYEHVYRRILEQAREPVIIHWLGEMFDPALAGYWGHRDHRSAIDSVLGIIAAHAHKVDGIKISLLDRTIERDMRRRLPRGVRTYTGDDFHYAELIAGDDQGHSDALLGIFDAIAPAASAALSALAGGDRPAFDAILATTVPLARHIFEAPTRFYKTGIVFMAYLTGLQDHFIMVGGQQSARSLPHLAELFRRADRAGLLRDPELAHRRMCGVLALYGIT